MRKSLFSLFTILFLFFKPSLFAQESWTQKASLDTAVNLGSVGCLIGNKEYVAVGNIPGAQLPPANSEFWAYDPDHNKWNRKAPLPEGAPAKFAFSIGNRGYFQFSTGIWEYDAPTDKWTRKINSPIPNAMFATGFSMGNKGYVAFAITNYSPYSFSFTSATNDFWEYDQTTDSWSRKADFPGIPTFNATMFNIGRKGYLAQTSSNPTDNSVFWEYDTASNSWTQKASFGGHDDLGSTGFSIAGKGYITTCYLYYLAGYYYATTTYLWKYDPARDKWDSTATFAGGGRVRAVSFAVNNTGYLGLGDHNQQRGLTGAYNDLWQYTPIIDSIPAATPLGSGNGLMGIYYNGLNLSGTPLLNRIDSTVNIELTYSKQPLILTPAVGIVPPERYSIRWTGSVQPRYSETYTFHTVSDDGIRLWVNGVQLVDNWTNHGSTENSGSISLVAGLKYDIVIEYYNNTGESVAKLLWSSPSMPKSIVPKSQLYTNPPAIGTGTGLYASYYNGINLSDPPLLNRVDSTINFQLTYSSQPLKLSPAPGIVPEDRYSVRWSGEVVPQYGETYTFYTRADDGIRLWVNGLKLIDNWATQGATEKSASIHLTAGQHYDIMIEYYEYTGEAIAQLFWSSPRTPKSIIPKSQLYPIARGLLANYYSNGTLLLTRIDSTINFDLSYGKTPLILSPAPGIVPDDNFSITWTGQIQAQYSELYTFYSVSDDGMRGTIFTPSFNDVANDWSDHAARETYGGSVFLTAGKKYNINVQYYENTGDAVAKLLWSSASTPKSVIPQTQLFPPNASNARTMDIPISAGTPIQPIKLTPSALSLSPNPVINGQSTVLEINSHESNIGVLTVISTNGTLMRTTHLFLVTGKNMVTVNTNGLTKGSYVLRLTNGNNISSKRLIVQ